MRRLNRMTQGIKVLLDLFHMHQSISSHPRPTSDFGATSDHSELYTFKWNRGCCHGNTWFGFLSCLEDSRTPGLRITWVKPVDLVLVTLMYGDENAFHKQPNGLIMPTKQRGSSFSSLLCCSTSLRRFIGTIFCGPVGWDIQICFMMCGY